ncbi:MAG: YlxR family protein [Eubacterium sp.]|nr:YlxR family protein [Eubacterium sp.]
MGQVRKVPMRTCIGCRQSKDKKELIRVVRNKENQIFVDLTGKQNGRGAYICADADCLEKAMKNKGLEKTLKISNVSEEVIEALKEQLGDINE